MASIYEKVLAFIHSPDSTAFEALALDVFRHQFEHVPPYRSYCLARHALPHSLRDLAAIPAVSTVAFKYARMESREESLPSSAPLLFRTSGTTLGRDDRGRHCVIRPEIYRASALGHLRRMLFADQRRTAMLALHPTADRMPDSSLSQMITWCIEEFGTGEFLCAATPRSVDIAAALGFLEHIARAGTPVTVLGTTAALAAIFAEMRAGSVTLALPAASRLMDTGGAKGQLQPLTAFEVVAEAQRALGIAPAMVINEYGMTEMCSQLYDATAFNSAHDPPTGSRVKLAPPWLRAVALDPATLAPMPAGEVGMLAFFDLANVGSVSALMTEDFGAVTGDGVAIIGRAAGDPRGCALAIEQFASRQRANPEQTV